jgi:hypothetical protein
MSQPSQRSACQNAAFRCQDAVFGLPERDCPTPGEHKNGPPGSDIVPAWPGNRDARQAGPASDTRLSNRFK